jgi:hypothetical protein
MVLLLAVGLTAAVGACGATETIEGPRPLSDEEAAKLAQATYANLLAGGAEFEANSAFLATQPRETVSLRGVVDWNTLTGRARVAATGPDATLVEVFWDTTAVYERRPAVDQIVAASGGPAAPWFVRSAEPSTRQVDRLIALVVGLASPQPENALLIQQTAGSGYIRADELRGEAVDVLRYGTRNYYWLAVTDGRLLRFEGDAASGGAPTVIDLIGPAVAEVSPPPESSLISATGYADLYSAVTGG